MFKLLLITTLFISACFPIRWTHPTIMSFNDQLLPTYVCANVPSEQFDAVKIAFEEWNVALALWKRFVVVKDVQSGCSYFVNETKINQCSGDSAIACANEIGGNTIFLNYGKYEKATKNIVMHEIAHTLGAQHVSDTLMNETYDKYTYECPDVTTVAQVAAYNRLNLATLSWCYR